MSTTSASIAHLDLDCFFVSVERINDPSLVGKPVVVGGSPTGRGVVASASYEARKFGIRSAMPAGQALRLCPSLTIVHGHHRQYSEISDRLTDRMREIAPSVQRASIDEMYLDFTGTSNLYGDDLPGYMVTLQRLIRDEFALPCTIALSANKLVSKIAANTVKPNGVITVASGTEKQFLARLPVEAIPGVGRKTEEYLKTRGLRTIEDIQRKTLEDLTTLLGKHGVWIYDAANGRGSTHVEEEHGRKSISREETFSHDIGNIAELERVLKELTTDVCSTLRKKHLQTLRVSVKLRYSDFTTFTRDKTIPSTNNDVEIFGVASALLRQHADPRKKLRLIGVRLSSLVDVEQMELDLFGRGEKDEQVLKVVDTLRERFGQNIISIGKTE